MAERYDREAAPYHVPFEQRLLVLADLKPGERVLDLGCGAGNLALAAARRVGDSGAVVGVDLAPGMVRVAVAKARRLGLTHARFDTMDARKLAFPDASLSAVVSCLGVPALGHERCFAAAHRVLIEGGRLAFCEGTGKGNEVGSVFHALLDAARPKDPAPEIRRLLDARRSVIATGQPKELRDPQAVRLKLERLGFRTVTVASEVHPIVYPTVDAYIARAAAWGDNERELRAMDETERKRFLEEFAERVAPFRIPAGLPAPQEILYVTARK